MDLKDSVEDFKTYLKVIRRRAANTVYDYGRTIGVFTKWANKQGVTDTNDLTAELLRSYVAAEYQHLSDGSFNLYQVHLRKWLQWLASEDRLGKDGTPWRTLIPRENPEPARQKQFVRKDEAYRVAQAAEAWHPRDRYFLEGLRGSARRRMELCSMKVGDIDLTPRPGFSRGVFTFDNTKGRKRRRTLGIPPEWRKSLDEWLPLYAELIGRPLEDDDYLYPAVKIKPGVKCIRGVRMPLELIPKKQLNRGSAGEIVARVTGKGAHGFRRGMAVDLKSERTRAGFSDGLALAQTLLDHATPKTTAVYMDDRQDATDLDAAFDQMAGTTPVPPAQPEPDPAVVDLATFRSRLRGSA